MIIYCKHTRFKSVQITNQLNIDLCLHGEINAKENLLIANF